MFERRVLLHLILTATFAPASAFEPAGRQYRSRRVSQAELDEAIIRHSLWLEEKHGGRRAVFSNCDLSGLNFHGSETEPVNLSGSDFTEADLSEISGGEVSFDRANLQKCDLSRSQLRSPVFSSATLRKALCVGVEWGWPSGGGDEPDADADQNIASFLNTDLSYSNFQNARVRGFFWGSTFHDSLLDCANFSWSHFAGKRHLVETSFNGANLRCASFRHAKIAAARFRRANLEGADFSFADVDPTIDLLTSR